VRKYSALPGEVSKTFPMKIGILSPRGDETELEKSAEVIVVSVKRDEGLNLNLGNGNFIYKERNHRKER
jgi:hypothetical protein